VALVKVTDRPGGTGRKEKSKDMKATHTPGPWIASRKNNGLKPLFYQPPVVLARGGYMTVADGLGDGPEAEANTKLIAAAPELLAALQEIADRGPVDGYTSAGALRLRLAGSQTIARAAIAKATA
jgi:hypothetical protein